MGKASDSYKSQLKQESAKLMPTQVNTLEAQRNLLYMVETVVPSVSAIRKNAEQMLWSKVQSGEMSIQDARRHCALNLNKIAGIIIIENLKLERSSKEYLTKAWGAMDTYVQAAGADRMGKLVALMDEIAAVLEEKATGRRPAPVPSAEEMSTVPIDTSKISIPTLDTFAPGQMSMTQAPVENAVKPPVKPAEKEDKQVHEEKRRANPLAMAIVAVLVVALVAGGISIAWSQVRVDRVEEAIDAIGTVTMEASGAIKNAELAYSELNESQQAKVENYDLLVAARAEYDRLEQLIADAINAIEDIGTVSLKSKAKIAKARAAYDALGADNLTVYAEEEGKILVAAEAEYVRLYGEDLFSGAKALYDEKKYAEAQAKFDQLLNECAGHAKTETAKDLAAKCVAVQALEKFNAGEYETTMRMLVDANRKYGASADGKEVMDKLLKRLDSIRPINGKKYKDGIGWGYGKLTVTADASDVCVKLVSVENPEEYMLFYVRAGESYEVSVKNGNYRVLYGTGEHWYGEKVGFGQDGEYKEVTKKYSFASVREGAYVYYNARKLNLTGSVDADDITYDQFWK